MAFPLHRYKPFVAWFVNVVYEMSVNHWRVMQWYLCQNKKNQLYQSIFFLQLSKFRCWKWKKKEKKECWPFQCSGEQRTKCRRAGPVDNTCELQGFDELPLAKARGAKPHERKSWLYGEKYNKIRVYHVTNTCWAYWQSNLQYHCFLWTLLFNVRLSCKYYKSINKIQTWGLGKDNRLKFFYSHLLHW